MSAPHNKPPTLTLIAGPNGSGKTTLVSKMLTVGNSGILVNADQIASSLVIRKAEKTLSLETQFEAAKAAEEMRWSLLSQQISFATETVMSDRGRWLEFVSEAKAQGYRVVLYFVTTEDPSINIKRVAERINAGGHAVDENKIISRYYRVMGEVLPVILTMVDEAILFDNSGANTGAIGVLVLKHGQLTSLFGVDQLPEWAKLLLAKFGV